MKEQKIIVGGYTLWEMFNYDNERHILIESPDGEAMECTEEEIEEMKETVLEYTLEYMAFKEQKKRKWEKWSKEGGKE